MFVDNSILLVFGVFALNQLLLIAWPLLSAEEITVCANNINAFAWGTVVLLALLTGVLCVFFRRPMPRRTSDDRRRFGLALAAIGGMALMAGCSQAFFALWAVYVRCSPRPWGVANQRAAMAQLAMWLVLMGLYKAVRMIPHPSLLLRRQHVQ